MTQTVRIAVAGAGLIGRRHIDAILVTRQAALSAIVDPATDAKTLAAELSVPWYASLTEMIAANACDAVILATPNQLHRDNALECIAAGIPVLVEKPITSDVASGEALVDAAAKAKVPVLVGHHRRHNPLMQRARQEISNGAIGDIVSISCVTWFYKPHDYFNMDWRRKPGAGPVYLNLIHDIDLMQFLCGPVETIHAMQSSKTRGFDVEDTAVISLRFASGALGTVNVSDTIVAPWSWELTARENPAYPPTTEPAYLIGGTHGSLELPGLRLWRNPGERSWWEPIDATQLAFSFEDPLIRQIRHFCAVVNGEEQPLVSGLDGLAALKVIEAVKQSATSGRTITL